MPGSRFDLAEGWLRKAADDLAAARLLIGEDGPTAAACFHAQQAAEKGMKAVLARAGAPIPRTPDLDEVHVARVESEPTFDLGDLLPGELTPFAVETRYDLSCWPDRSVAERAIAVASGIVERCRAVVLPAG